MECGRVGCDDTPRRYIALAPILSACWSPLFFLELWVGRRVVVRMGMVVRGVHLLRHIFAIFTAFVVFGVVVHVEYWRKRSEVVIDVEGLNDGINREKVSGNVEQSGSCKIINANGILKIRAHS